MANQNGRHFEEVERLSIFELSGKLFGIDILRSREVIPLPRFTPLPNSEEIYRGVYNLRGDIYPLVDISPILGLLPKQIQADDMVVLIDDNQNFNLGVLVDKIHGVSTCSPADLKIPKGLVSRTLEIYTRGVLYHKHNLIHVLDLDSLFKTKQILAHY